VISSASSNGNPTYSPATAALAVRDPAIQASSACCNWRSNGVSIGTGAKDFVM